MRNDFQEVIRTMADIVDTSKFYPGMKLKWQGGLWEVVECQHHMKGRGGAVLKCKMRNLDTGSISENSFVSGNEDTEIENLDTGKQYILHEIVAPDGYTLTSDTTFSPAEPCTRGQVVTFLWRKLK